MAPVHVFDSARSEDARVVHECVHVAELGDGPLPQFVDLVLPREVDAVRYGGTALGLDVGDGLVEAARDARVAVALGTRGADDRHALAR
jgi:hypothetical protein